MELTEGDYFLGAVQNVLHSGSSATEADLLSAAACQYLRHGPASVEEVCAATERIWPDSRPTIERVEAALDVSRELGLVSKVDASANWQLTANGLADIQHHDGWVSNLRERTSAEIRARSRQGLGVEPDSNEAQLWLDALFAALIPAIAKSLTIHLGSAKSLIEGKAPSKILDPQPALDSLSAASPRQEIVEFLQSLAVSALDPLDPFGREMVTHIATGAVLQTYVAGASGAQLSSLLGKPEHQRAIIDTPFLLEMIGPRQEQKDVEKTIRRAVKDGWDVIVPEHSIEELNELVEREIPNLRNIYIEASKSNTRLDFYAGLVDDQFHGMVIMALREGTYKSLDDVVVAAKSLTKRLNEMGVVVRHHGNGISPDRKESCHNALNEYLSQFTRQRSSRVVLRDAETLTMAWRRRRRESSANWPGAWIITTDRAMNHAYGSVSNDRVPITLTLAQWTTVLSISAEPEELSGLASLAAGQFVDEAIWDLPARFPKEFAIKLATRLSPEQGGSNLDLYHARLHNLPEMLDEIAQNSTPSSLAAEVMASRARRLNALNDIDRSYRNEQIASAYVDVTDAQARELEAQRKLNHAEQERQKLMQELQTEQRARTEEKNHANRDKKRFKRILISILVVFVALLSFVISLIFGGVSVAIISGVAVLASLVLTIRWCRNLDENLNIIAWSIGVDLIGFISAVQSLLSP
ncbi:AAA family ATPase [Glutamicibacter ardleyensis]|uniref:Uncharacterized protein n=1 Tax=Glutamicibacter ardleyensis TaxID=225894 RepID=A0ABQ2DYT2_9MICC|nr:hypothetical protein [Glutamicibacter ardleyensis]GGJ73285.1 hypothetical protein GCM10007173_35370 [Glutamicibacter ardleyensis]